MAKSIHLHWLKDFFGELLKVGMTPHRKKRTFPVSSENISWLKEFGLAESEKEKVVTQS